MHSDAVRKRGIATIARRGAARGMWLQARRDDAADGRHRSGPRRRSGLARAARASPGGPAGRWRGCRADRPALELDRRGPARQRRADQRVRLPSRSRTPRSAASSRPAASPPTRTGQRSRATGSRSRRSTRRCRCRRSSRRATRSPTCPTSGAAVTGRSIDTGYDCSGSISFVFAAAGILNTTMVSGELMHWGGPAPASGSRCSRTTATRSCTSPGCASTRLRSPRRAHGGRTARRTSPISPRSRSGIPTGL